MDTEDLASDDRCDREGIEDVDESLPCLDVCTPFTLVVESVDCSVSTSSRGRSDSVYSCRTTHPL